MPNLSACESVYGNLKNKEFKREGLFISEGAYVTRRLIASDWEIHSLLVSQHLAAEFAPLVKDRCPVISMPESEISQIVGYRFHRGVLAAGKRPNLTGLEAFLKVQPQASKLVIAPLVTELENLGTIIRNTAALGADALLFGHSGCDPLDRRVIRVSMGSVFSLPLIPIDGVGEKAMSYQVSSIESLKKFGFEVVGTVLEPSATPLHSFIWPKKTALLFGNETMGIPKEWREACGHFVTIPMHAKIDSLNLGVASGIFLHSLASASGC